MRVACVSFDITGLEDFTKWQSSVSGHVQFAKDHNAELILFPEYICAPLVSSAKSWESWTEKYCGFMKNLAKNKAITIIAGTHLTKQENSLFNQAFVFLANGQEIRQNKFHATPFEREFFNVRGGGAAHAFVLGDVKFAIAICYDVEFPGYVQKVCELTKCDVLLVPSCTDDIHGYWRVRHCAQARCVEEQIYVLQSPLVGSSTSSRGFEQNVGSAGVYSPCDVGFAQRGIMAEGAFSKAECIVVDLDIERIRALRRGGSVSPLQDRKDYSNSLNP